MCGIGGWHGDTIAVDDEFMLLNDILRPLHVRGPDGSSVWRKSLANQSVCLMSTRLSITDPELSDQPFRTPMGTVAVFNGEIYNFLELRRRVVADGRLLSTNGDGEIIPHLYEMYGSTFPTLLQGQFAIALFDPSTQALLLCRDRLGEKPLYFSRMSSRVVFSSQLKTFDTLLSLSGDLDSEAVDSYLHFGYVTNGRTVLANVCKVEPGTITRFRHGSRGVGEAVKWWDSRRILPSWSPSKGPSMVDQYASDKLRGYIHQQSRSDFPVGIALSAGIDSSLLASAAQNDNQAAYSVRFAWGNSNDDETQAAAQFAKSLSMAHRIIEVPQPTYTAALRSVAQTAGEPVADWTAPAYDALARACAEDGRKVLITGHGADESLLAYEWLKNARIGQDTFLSLYSHNPEFREAKAVSGSIYGERLSPLLDERDRHFPVRDDRISVKDQMRHSMLRGYLASNAFSQMDQISMRHGVESRCTFGDPRIIELLLAIDYEAEVLHHDPKWQLWELARLWKLEKEHTRKKPFYPKLVNVLDEVWEALASSDTSRLVNGGYLIPDYLRHLTSRGVQSKDVCLRILVLEEWLNPFEFNRPVV